MRSSEGGSIGFALVLLISLATLGLSGCGGSSSGSSSSPTLPAPSTTKNTQAIEVNSGPANNYVNGIFTTVTICVPGTSNCQSIPNVLVDTASEGLRLLSSQVTLSLPAVTDNSSNVLQECMGFSDGSFVWGSVVGADIQLAGEKGSSVPIQLIDTSNPTKFPVPNACLSGGGQNENTVSSLGANGILGIGTFQQDCGLNCQNNAVQGAYYLCPSGVCSPTAVNLNYQLQNPVWTFPQDNNGALISLPSIPDTGAPTASGSLIFGIGTQSDNGLGSAGLYTTDTYGNIQTVYQNTSYPAFFDTGSNANYFMDSTTLGIADCTDYPGFYCPGSTTSYAVTNNGLNGTSGQVNLNVANADALFAANNSQNWAFSNLGGDSGTGPSSDYFDFGLPFFFGRNIFVGIENMPGPNGVTGPYYAF